MHVDQPPVTEVVITPDLFEQVLPAEHLSRVVGEFTQEAELGAGAMDLLAVASHDAGVGLDLDITEADDRVAVGVGT